MKYFIFDVDDTLYLRSEPFIRACIQTFPALADIDSETLYTIRKKHSDFSFDEMNAGRMTSEEMYLYRTKETFREFSIDLSSEEALAFENLYAQMLGKIRLHPDAESILAYLRAKEVPMAVITNGFEERQKNKMKALQLQRYIEPDRWLVSGEIGIDKPDVRIFHHAGQKFHISPQDAWYIGDSYTSDILGAKSAGWHTIWLSRRAEPSPAENLADYTVSSYDALFSLLKALCGTGGC